MRRQSGKCIFSAPTPRTCVMRTRSQIRSAPASSPPTSEARVNRSQARLLLLRILQRLLHQGHLLHVPCELQSDGDAGGNCSDLGHLRGVDEAVKVSVDTVDAGVHCVQVGQREIKLSNLSDNCDSYIFLSRHDLGALLKGA